MVSTSTAWIPETGVWTHVQHIGDLVNPSFLVLSRDQRFLYAVHGDESYATSFSVDRNTGFLTLLNRVETGGRNGVHLAIDPSNKFMLVANYGTGNVSVLPVQPDGTLGDQVQLVPLPGLPGPNRIEQASSHPHQIVFDPSGKYVVVPDKGLDRIFIFSFDPATDKLTPTEQGSAVARSGSGPRHAAFHPTMPVLFVLNEIGSSVATYYLEAEHGSLRPVEILPTLPSGLHRREHGRGDRDLSQRPVRVLFQPRPRQHRDVCRGREHGPADFDRLGIEPRPGASFHWFRSVSPIPLRRQRAVRHGGKLARGFLNRPPDAGRPGGSERKSRAR